MNKTIALGVSNSFSHKANQWLYIIFGASFILQAGSFFVEQSGGIFKLIF